MTLQHLSQNTTSSFVSSEKGRIAITGGRGRLARLAAAFLRDLGYDVILFSRISGEGFQRLESLCDPSVMGAFAAIFHFAWSTVPLTSEADPGCEEREDLPFLKKLLTGLASLEKPPKFVFLSSASVYGNTEEVPVNEVATCHPRSGYARAKLKAEEMIMTALDAHAHLSAAILRVSNVTGFPSDPKRLQGVLPRIIAVAKEGQTLEIWGDGCCSKDYLWIDDFLLALQATLVTPLKGIFNLGSGENFSVLDLVSVVEKTLGLPISLSYRPRYEWDVFQSRIDSSAFSEMANWKPQSNIRKGIEQLALAAQH